MNSTPAPGCLHDQAQRLAALGFAIAAVVIGDPFQARDAGFALSVLATAGAANKLAITLMGAKYPESAINTGEQKTVAAIGSAKA